jgi:hypothetical protein
LPLVPPDPPSPPEPSPSPSGDVVLGWHIEASRRLSSSVTEPLWASTRPRTVAPLFSVAVTLASTLP